MSSCYSNQPEFGADPYSYIIGKPRSKRESHKAMESWTDSHYHPSCGTSTIRLHNWERSRRGVSFVDPREDGVYIRIAIEAYGRPSLVNRYLWFPLWGSFGMVISTKPASMALCR